MAVNQKEVNRVRRMVGLPSSNGNTEEDLLIKDCIEDATYKFAQLTNRDYFEEVSLSDHGFVIRRLAIFYYEQAKRELGVSSYSQGDVSVTYKTNNEDIPVDILKDILSFRKLKICKLAYPK